MIDLSKVLTLSLEQQLTLRQFKDALQKVESKSELRAELLRAFKLVMQKDNVIKHFMKQELMPDEDTSLERFPKKKP